MALVCYYICNYMSNISAFNLSSASFMSKMFVADEQVYKFQIWDTAGQERVSYKLSVIN